MPHHAGPASPDPAMRSGSAPIKTIRTLRAKAVGCAAMLLAISISPAGAGTLPDTSGSVILSQGNTETSQFGAGPISLGIGNGAVEGTVSYLPSPNLSANAAVYGEGNASSYETAEYYFRVVGPANVDVPLTVAAAATLSLGVATPNVAELYVGKASGPLLTENACYGAIPINCTGDTFRSGFSVTAPITVESDQIGDNVQLSLSVNANTIVSGASSDIQSGYIDPVITIDPSFSLASEFQLVFSPDVGNSPNGVPEPTAVALFVIGLVGLGGVRIMSKRRFRGLGVGIALILGILASPPKAVAGTVSVIEDVSGTPGDWTLDFSILNKLTAGFDVYYLALPTLTTASDVPTGSPSGWAPPERSGVSWCVLPSQCFSSVSNNGTEISGFQIQSSDVQYPGPLPYLVYAIDWTNDNPPDPGCINCGFNPGYAGTTEVPEPSSWILFAGSIIVMALASICWSRGAGFARTLLRRRVSYNERS
jgi:hypothetical protein